MTHQIDQQDQDFPEYLTSYNSLKQHIRGQLEGLSTTEKGDRFAHFVQRLVPQTEIGSDFGLPELSEKKSGDEGVDLLAQGKDDRSVLYIQARSWIDRAATIDSIVSQFKAYLATHHSEFPGQQTQLFEFAAFDDRPPHFLVATLSPLENVLKSYKKSGLASNDFYRKCVAERRLFFVDGHQIFSILRAAYSKMHSLRSDVVLHLETQVIHKDNVFFRIISGRELQKLYDEFGDALFFENIRDFLGPSRGQSAERAERTTPNHDIIKTVTRFPDKMLQRNNGIVFRADEVKLNESRNQLELSGGSVVNGCQTTMCVVNYAEQLCDVPVKVVQTTDSWDIAKAANFQNSVTDIDLEIARNLRPQLAKKAATPLGVRVDDGERSAFQVIDEIYDLRVAYRETRLLYIGLFSQTPNNVFDVSYLHLKKDLIDRFYQEEPDGTKVFEVLFALQGASQEGLKEAENTFKDPSYAGMFQRFYKEDNPSYRCFVSILALCGAVKINIADRKQDGSDIKKEYERTRDFLSNARKTLQNRKDMFSIYYKYAVKIWMQEMIEIDADDAEIKRKMASRSRGANFTNMFRKLSMEADMDDRLREEEPEFQQRNA